MFEGACPQIRESVYGIMGLSQIGKKVNATNGAGFMIAPNYITTVAHVTHYENNFSKPNHQRFEIIRTLDIGIPSKNASLVFEDPVRDIAILKVDDPSSKISVVLDSSIKPPGTPCGSLGFPLSGVTFNKDGTRSWNLQERFRSAYISRFFPELRMGRPLTFYETDTAMYEGSSGCPGFLADGKVMGMQVATVNMNKVIQVGKGKQRQTQTERTAISIWIPSPDIISFAKQKGVLP